MLHVLYRPACETLHPKYIFNTCMHMSKLKTTEEYKCIMISPGLVRTFTGFSTSASNEFLLANAFITAACSIFLFPSARASTISRLDRSRSAINYPITLCIFQLDSLPSSFCSISRIPFTAFSSQPITAYRREGRRRSNVRGCVPRI